MMLNKQSVAASSVGTGQSPAASNGWGRPFDRKPETEQRKYPCDSAARGNIDMPASEQDDQTKIFARVIAKLKAKVGMDVFNSWFASMQLAEASQSVVRLTVPTPFLRSWITSHYKKDIEALWRDDNPDLMKLEITVRSASRVRPVAPDAHDGEAAIDGRTELRDAKTGASKSAAATVSMGVAPQPVSTKGAFGSPLDRRLTFSTFVSGEANRIAHVAAKSVAESGTKPVRFNPLYIHSSVGLGKTHLLQAIAWEALSQRPSAKVVYLTAEYFMYRFAAAVRDNHALALKEQLRDIDLLIIDDMQFLQGNTIQNEFCHLINMLLDSAKQVVVAADRPAAELGSLDARMRSRMQGGMTVDLRAPDYDMRLQMLKGRLAAAQQDDMTLDIPLSVLEHLAQRVAGSGRELEGAFNQLLFRRSFESDLSLEIVDEMLSTFFRAGEARRVRIEDIQRIVARHYNIPRTELSSARRTRTIVRPRQVAMYLCKVLTPRSLPEIGRRFGNRDHTTVLHAVRKIETLASEDTGLKQELHVLQQMIEDQSTLG